MTTESTTTPGTPEAIPCDHPASERTIVQYPAAGSLNVETGRREVCTGCGTDFGPATPKAYNVRTTVVDMVEADTEAGAIERLHAALEKAGFTVYLDPPAGYEPNAFESEEIPCKVAADPTGNTPLWECGCPECVRLERDISKGAS